VTGGRGSAVLVGAVGALAAAVPLRRAVAGRPRWTRSNYRGTTVSLAGGPAVAIGALAAATCAAAPGAVVCGTVAGVLGLYDDLFGETHARAG
jgi:hypothetical protein